jgi:hypothetical protein
MIAERVLFINSIIEVGQRYLPSRDIGTFLEEFLPRDFKPDSTFFQLKQTGSEMQLELVTISGKSIVDLTMTQSIRSVAAVPVDQIGATSLRDEQAQTILSIHSTSGSPFVLQYVALDDKARSMLRSFAKKLYAILQEVK